MTVRHSPGSTRLGRLLRGLQLDGNPLRRRSDRAETLFLGVLIAAFAACAPLAAHTAGSWTHAASAHEAQVQQRVTYHVTATLLEAMPAWGANGAGPYPETEARWTAPDGKVRTGLVAVPGGASTGSTVTVWGQHGPASLPVRRCSPRRSRAGLSWLKAAPWPPSPSCSSSSPG